MKGIEKMKRISDASPRLGILIVILGLIHAIIGISIDISEEKFQEKAHIATDGGKSIFVIMGCIPIIIGIVVIVISIKKHKKFKALINNGMCATGTIVNFRVDTSATLNAGTLKKEHPYIAEVEVTDAITGEKRRYDSEWVNSSDQSMKGSSVAVYIDKSYYYIDWKNKIANNNYR